LPLRKEKQTIKTSFYCQHLIELVLYRLLVLPAYFAIKAIRALAHIACGAPRASLPRASSHLHVGQRCGKKDFFLVGVLPVFLRAERPKSNYRHQPKTWGY